MKPIKSSLNHSKLLTWALSLGLSIGLNACSHSPVKNAPPDEPVTTLKKADLGRIDIQYTRERDSFQLLVVPVNHTPFITLKRNHSIIESGEVDESGFTGFFTKTAQFVSKFNHDNRSTAGTTGCRTPFTVSVQSNGHTAVAKGCRSPSDAGLSKLISEGEFLLYSKN